jgi:hypothetical protein
MDNLRIGLDACTNEQGLAHIFPESRYREQLQRIVDAKKEHMETVRLAGSASIYSLEQATREYEEAVQLQATAETLIAEHRPTCARANSPCPNADSAGSDCDSLDVLAGRWHNEKYGGVIELRLEAEGTLSGYVLSINEIMLAEGYEPGMQIMRGFRLGGVDGITWAIWTEGGEIFSAVKPDRTPGQPWGEAQWITNGNIHIDKSLPNNLSMPPLLESRLGNYETWEFAGR